MIKVFIFAAAALLLFANAAQAQMTPRAQCCKEMGGRWEEGRSRAKAGQMVCAGVAADPYYKCVEGKTLGKK